MSKETFSLDLDDQVKQISIVCYFTEKQVQDFCLNFAQHYAFITHDKDVKDDGTPKERHIHLLATFHSKTLVSAILRRLQMCVDSEQTILFKAMCNRHSAYDYLTHKNHPDRYQYPSDSIVTDSASFWTKTNEEIKADENAQFLEDLTTLSPKDMALKYGRDYIRNFQKYEFFSRMITSQGQAPIHDELEQNVEQLNNEQLVDFLEYQERRYKRNHPNASPDDIQHLLKDASEWYKYHREQGSSHNELKFTNTTLF